MYGLPGRECHRTNLTARRLPTVAAEVADSATVLCGDRAELQVFPSLDMVIGDMNLKILLLGS